MLATCGGEQLKSVVKTCKVVAEPLEIHNEKFTKKKIKMLVSDAKSNRESIRFKIKFVKIITIVFAIFVLVYVFYFRKSEFKINSKFNFKQKDTLIPYNNTNLEDLINYSNTYIGKISWFEDENIPFMIKSSKYNYCRLCDFKTVPNSANSSSDDLILGTLYGNSQRNVLTFVRSVRTAGCKASIVIFITENISNSLSEEYHKNLENCGVTLLDIPYYERVRGIHPNLIRHLHYSIFISKFQNYFNRVLIVDLFDTFVQKDPFSDKFDVKYVSFTYETTPFASNKINRDWVRNIDLEYDENKYKNNIPLCAGLFSGTTHSLLKFYDIFVNLSHWEWINTKCRDQRWLNYLYYNNKLQNIAKIDKNHHLLSSLFVNFNKNYDRYGLVQLGATTPAVIHQYDRRGPSSIFIKEKCSPLGIWQTNPFGMYNYTDFESS